MTDFELGWLVGFFEGEGNFAFTSNDLTARRSRGTVRLCIVQSDFPLLEKVQTLTGVGNIHVVKRYAAHHKPHWRWEIFGPTAIKLGWELFPHLSPRRREQWLAVVEQWLHIRDLQQDRAELRRELGISPKRPLPIGADL